MNENTEKLLSALTKDIGQDDTVRSVIFIGAPDPDSIGSALGIRHLIQKKYSGSADIVCSGEISHPQNKTMLVTLNLQIIPEEDFLSQLRTSATGIEDKYNKFIFVDMVPTMLKWYGEDNPVTIVIDHHKGTYENDTAFVQIQQVGACCSLVWEHLKNANIALSQDDDSGDVATAMLMGIKTDTSDLLIDSTSQVDFDAYEALTKSSNKKHVSSIINYKLPTYYFELKGRLSIDDNTFCEHSFFIGCLGQITQSGRDSVPMFADERLRMEGITTSIVFAFVEDNIVASLRTSNASIDAHALMQKIFGKEFGGGKQGAAAAKVPLGVLSVKDLPKEIQETAVAQYRDIIINKIKMVCFNN